MSLSFSDAVKAKQLREYFNRHGRIYIVVDATREEVIVPESLSGDPALRLVLNVRMPQVIQIHDDVLQSDFSFSGHIFSCHIPMHTIWAAYLPEGDMEQGIIWDDSVPEMIKAVVQEAQGQLDDVPEQAEPALHKAERPAAMTVIEGGGEKQPASEQTRKTRHLRVVK